jgi:riboflavin kinase/FMN adenylyltransferase
VLSFFPLPKQVVGNGEPRFYLTSPDDRARLLQQLGIDLVVTLPFDQQLREMRATDFVDLLLERLDLREIWVGPDFALGYQREGDVDFLKKQGQAKGFEVCTVDFFRLAAGNPLAGRGPIVSSSLIRQALREGRLQDANHWLGRPYRIAGQVVHGDQRGRSLGFPTANLSVWEEQVMPARGVYAGCAWLDNERRPAAVNIGVRPTVTAGETLTVEAHLIDLDCDLYGKDLAVDLYAPIRPEFRFDSREALTAQMARDVEEARQVFLSAPAWGG